MSQRSIDNAVVGAIKLKLDSMKMTVADMRDNVAIIKKLRDDTDDDRVRFNASKLLHDTEIKIAELEYKMYEHDFPAVQKQEIQLLAPPSALQIEIVKPKE